jgi:hypothetical protein
LPILLDHRAGEKRVPIPFQRDGQALAPGGPLAVEMTPDPDLIDCGLEWIRFKIEVAREDSLNQPILNRIIGEFSVRPHVHFFKYSRPVGADRFGAEC